MILRHFTLLENAERIKREGLWAAPQYQTEENVNFVGGSLVLVYLTAAPSSAMTDGGRSLIWQLSMIRPMPEDKPFRKSRHSCAEEVKLPAWAPRHFLSWLALKKST